MRLCVLLTTRGLLLSSVSLRSSHRSISACASQVNNPNNHAYWKSRRYSSRPDNWESAAAQRAAEGRSEARANAAASRTSGERAVAGRRTDTIVRAVKAALGGHVQVRKAGSQAKRTAVAGRSDYDLWVDVGEECVSRTQRKVLRDYLTSMLTGGGDRAVVLLRETGIRIEFEDTTHFDVVFSNCCFSDKRRRKPAQRFENNPKARDAVRLIKDGSPQKFKGEDIEKAVLAAQGRKKGQSRDTLAFAAFCELANWPQVVQFREWLSDDDDWDEEDARLFEEDADAIEMEYFD